VERRQTGTSTWRTVAGIAGIAVASTIGAGLLLVILQPAGECAGTDGYCVVRRSVLAPLSALAVAGGAGLIVYRYLAGIPVYRSWRREQVALAAKTELAARADPALRAACWGRIPHRQEPHSGLAARRAGAEPVPAHRPQRARRRAAPARRRAIPSQPPASARAGGALRPT
jgi:hypothetical protein